MTIRPGFQKTRKEQMVQRDASVNNALTPGEVELARFGSPLLELGSDRTAYADEISRLWAEAQDRFLKIGRYLVRAKERLPHGSFEAMIAAELPFGRHVAWQLRIVATAVDGGRLDEDRLPNSYATAFKLATLDDDVLDLAKAHNVVRPSVTRAEVSAFVRRVSSERDRVPNRREQLSQERTQLRRQIKKMNVELGAAQSRLAAVENELLKGV